MPKLTQRSAMPFAGMIDAFSEAAFLHDAEGRIVHLNPAAREFFAVGECENVTENFQRLCGEAGALKVRAIAGNATAPQPLLGVISEMKPGSSGALLVADDRSNSRWEGIFSCHAVSGNEVRLVTVRGVNGEVRATPDKEEPAPEDLKLAHRRVESELGNLQRLHDLSTRLSPEADFNALLCELLEAVCELLDSQFGCIQLADDERGVLRMNTAVGFSPEVLAMFSETLPGQGGCGTAFQRKERVIVEDVEKDPLFKGFAVTALRTGIRAVCATPLKSRTGEVLGVLSVNFHRPHRPNERQLQMVDLYARQAAEVIESARRRAERRRAEAELRESEKALRLALDAANLGAWIYSLPDQIMEVDERAADLYQAKGRQLNFDESSIRKLLHPDDVKTMLAAIHAACNPRGDGRFKCTFRIRQPNGRFKWISAWGRTDFEDDDEERVAVRIVGASRDVTAHRQAEEDLRRSETNFRALADNISQLAWMTDAEGWIFWLNKRWFDYTGGSIDEVEGWNWSNLVHPQHRERVVENFRRSMAERRDLWEDTFPLRGKDGNYRWFLTRAQPIRDESGLILRWFGTNTDVTERLEVEEALRYSQLRLQIAMGAASLGTFDHNLLTGTLHWDSQCREILGVSPDEPASVEKLLSLVHPECREQLERDLEYYWSHAGCFEYEYRILPADGSPERWLHTSAQTISASNDDSRPIRLIGALRDITAEKNFTEKLARAKETAEAASRSKSEFLANMSHEIRTPMTAILGFAEILQQRVEDPMDLECVDTIRRNGNFLLEIINDILDLSKIEAGRLEVRQERVRPWRLISEVKRLMDVRAEEKNLQLRVRAMSPLPTVMHTDARRLRQILVNLVGNAIKFTDSGYVEIRLRLLRKEELLEIAIQDTGIGIPQDDMQRLFQPFSQLNTVESGGTGLGLAISRRLASMLGGSIDVESEVGKGSTFTVTISTGDLRNASIRAFEEIPDPDTVTALPSSQRESLNSHILVVDDSPEMRNLARRLLERAGARVTCADNGLEAICCIQRTPGIEAVLLDMRMPKLDGYKTVARLRAESFDGPIVAMTANALKDDCERCLRAGCDAYFSKPLDGKVLVRTLASLIGEPVEAAHQGS